MIWSRELPRCCMHSRGPFGLAYTTLQPFKKPVQVCKHAAGPQPVVLHRKALREEGAHSLLSYCNRLFLLLLVFMQTVLGIILGGGAGTRLYPLTKKRAKPAVPLGANYRLIDIPVSNCVNSNVTKIYCLTQFNSASLNRHLSQAYVSGQCWLGPRGDSH